MSRYGLTGLALAWAVTGCPAPASKTCAGPDGASWVCPSDLSCGQAPNFCIDTTQAQACMNGSDYDACTLEGAAGICLSGGCQMCTGNIAGCWAVGWQAMSSAPGAYSAVWAGPAALDAWAGSDLGMTRYNGISWSPDSSFQGSSSVAAIAGTSADHVFVLTTTQNVAFHYNGAAWSMAATPDALKAIWASDTDDAWGVGIAGHVDQYKNGTWTDVGSAGSTTLTAIWGTSDTDIDAVDVMGNLWHYDGSTWASSKPAGTNALYAVWGASTDDIYIAGLAGLYHQPHAGSAFYPELPATGIKVIWGSGPNDVFAAGSGALYHSDGTGLWLALAAPSGTVYGISGSSPTEVLAATDQGMMRYAGTAWSPAFAIPAATPALASVSATSATGAIAVGAAHASIVYDGSAWTEHDIGAGTAFTGVYAAAPAQAFAVDDSTAIQEWNGSAWMADAFTNGGENSFAAVGGANGKAYAAGTALFEYAGGAWGSAATFSDINATAVWVAPDGDVFVAGAMIERWSGGALTPFTSTMLSGASVWRGLWGTSSSDVFAVGDGGEVSHFDGQSWTPPTSVATSALRGVWGFGSGDVYAAGAGATVLHYHAGAWAPIAAAPGTTADIDYSGVAGTGVAAFFAGTDGTNGTCVRLIETAPEGPPL